MLTHQTQADAHKGLTVLIPIDGSEVAMKALEYARLFPLSSVSLMYVIPTDVRIQPPLTEREKHQWAAVAISNLTVLQADLGAAGIESSFEIRVGDVAEEISVSAERCDLIVMTTSGRGAAGRVVFGSVADRVSRSSTTPTLLIRGNVLPGNLKRPTRILVPLDGSKRAEAALTVARELAHMAELPITLVRAVDLDDVLSTSRQGRARVELRTGVTTADEPYDAASKETVDQVGAYLEGIAASLRTSNFQVQTEILHGTPVFMLLAEIEDTDLVVMTSHGHGGYQRWLLGSVAEKLIREAKSPILLVPSRDPSASP